jgi:hypothetical protein
LGHQHHDDDDRHGADEPQQEAERVGLGTERVGRMLQSTYTVV